MRMQTPQDLNINEWQALIDEVKAMDQPPRFVKDGKPLAMRIENTMLTTARYAGGCRVNGCDYIYFEPLVPGETNSIGKPYVAWLIVRDEFVRYVSKKLKKAKLANNDNQN